jgi:DNA-binding transcriptional LysR family regulator
MPGHPTQRTAATALGLHEVVLMRHRQHIEHAAGIRIFQPGQPLTPTPEGARFLSQAAQALRQLDLTSSAKS